MGHPVLAAAEAVEATLKDVAGAEPLFMPTAEKAAALRVLHRAEAELVALRLRVLAVAADVADETAARDQAAWVAHEVHADGSVARADLRLASALAHTWRQTETALAEGRLSRAHAEVIVRVLGDLPEDTDTELLARAEAHLIGLATEFDPKRLRILGRHVLEVIAPEVGEAAEYARLQAEEAEARRHTTLTLRSLGDGTSLLKARIPDLVAERLATYLHAYTSPRHQNTTDASNNANESAVDSANASDGADPLAESAPIRNRRYDVALGEAFCSLLEHLDPTRLPIHGGAATTIMVTLDLDTLRTGLGVATTGAGDELTASEVRRLACTADLIPAVLGTDSEILDLGRTARLYTKPQRRAMALRDKTCRAEGCDIPAPWTEAHHLQPWSRGGRTDLDDGALLCSHHHHQAHDPSRRLERLPGGDLRFHRRT